LDSNLSIVSASNAVSWRRFLACWAVRGRSYYVIFFRYEGDSVEVVNICEGHRDIDAYFRNDPV